MREKVITGMMLLATGILLTGCHLSHEWKEATCTEPRTCTVGGETEGEALGHTWVDATCTEAKTCSVCGETEGEALGHAWTEATCTEAKTCSVCGATEGEALGHSLTEANYQMPATCTVCGETVGEPLTPGFVAANLECTAQEGVTYEYSSVCYADTSVYTVGELTFSDYKIFESDETHPAKDGYEWRTLHAQVLFNDDNAWVHGATYANFLVDYYEDGADSEVNLSPEYGVPYTTSFNGIDYTECMHLYDSSTCGWVGRQISFDFDFAFLVPVGYDGAVVGFHDYEQIMNDASMLEICESALMFRLQ